MRFRARRVVWSVAALLVGGALASVLAAECVGLSGNIEAGARLQVGAVDFRGRLVRVMGSSGLGWHFMTWNVSNGVDPRIPRTPYVIPAWSSLWRPDPWTIDPRTGAPIAFEQGSQIVLGWPAPALCMHWSDERPSMLIGGMYIGHQTPTRIRVLAWRTFVSGLLLDTLVWAGLTAGIVGLTRAAVRSRRHWRGQCPACAYDLRGLAAASTCPECGRATVPPTGPASI